MSLAIFQEKISFTQLGSSYHILKRRLITVHGRKDVGILIAGREDAHDERLDNKSGLILLPVLENALERGNYEDCKTVLGKAVAPLLNAASMHDMKALELYYNISMIYLKFINENGWEEKIPFYIGLYPLMRVDGFSDWSEAVVYLDKLLEAVFRVRNENDDYHKDRTIIRVEQYIREHLKEDLSLSVLADVGGYNASYLSRIFKQKCQCNLYEYITMERMNRARELLSKTDEKIYKIGEAVGYGTVTSFNRIFQKMEKMSPAEYRSRYQNKS